MATQKPVRADKPLHEQLRLELLSGAYAPGERLRMAALCERYGVSLSVVREALTRLAEQGLARAERNRGFAMIPLSLDDLLDLTTARVLIEQATIRRSVARGDVAWEGDIVAAHHRLTRTPLVPPAQDAEQALAWSAAHSHFHASLSAACASPRLLEIRQQLYDAAEIYRVWLNQKLSTVRDDRGEHEQLMNAVLDRDADRACDLAVAHIIETTEQAGVLEFFAEGNDPDRTTTPRRSKGATT